MNESFLISEMRILHCDRLKILSSDCDKERDDKNKPPAEYSFFEILSEKSKRLFLIGEEHFETLINLECKLREADRKCLTDIEWISKLVQNFSIEGEQKIALFYLRSASSLYRGLKQVNSIYVSDALDKFFSLLDVLVDRACGHGHHHWRT